MIKENHIEMSCSDTLIVACKDCPLTASQIDNKQMFNNIVCCVIEGQQINNFTNYECPNFNKVIYGTYGFKINCEGLKNEIKN